MTAFLYSLLAASSAVGCELFYRAHPGQSWASMLYVGIPCALITNFGIWGTLQTQSVLGLAVVFSLCTAVLRVAWTLAHGDHVSAGAWAAFTLVVLASLVKAVWR